MKLIYIEWQDAISNEIGWQDKEDALEWGRDSFCFIHSLIAFLLNNCSPFDEDTINIKNYELDILYIFPNKFINMFHLSSVIIFYSNYII